MAHNKKHLLTSILDHKFDNVASGTFDAPGFIVTVTNGLITNITAATLGDYLVGDYNSSDYAV